MKAIFKRELGYYLKSPVGYIVIILFAVFANFLYVKDLFVMGSGSLRSFFSVIPWLYLIFVPAVAMRSLAEEKRLNTVEVLLTLPVSETQIVLGKFFALMTVTAVGLLLTFGLPVGLAFVARIYLPEVGAAYIGSFLIAAAYMSVSLFFSAQTKNQVVAFLFSILSLFFFSALSSDFLAGVLPKVVSDALTYFAPLYHLQNFTKGLLDLRSVFYFISAVSVFLFLTIVSLEKRE